MDGHDIVYVVYPDVDDEGAERKYSELASRIKKYIKNREFYLFDRQTSVRIRPLDEFEGDDFECAVFLGNTEDNRYIRRYLEGKPFRPYPGKTVIGGREYENGAFLFNAGFIYIFSGENFDGDLFYLDGGYTVKSDGRVLEKGLYENSRITSCDRFETASLPDRQAAKSRAGSDGSAAESPLMDEAVRFFHSRRDDTHALKLFEVLNTMYPGNDRIRTYLSRLLFRMGFHMEALETAPQTHWGRLTGAKALIALGYSAEGKEELKGLLADSPPENIEQIALFWLDDPGLDSTRFVRSRVDKFLRGSLDSQKEAIADMKRRIASNPLDSELHRGLGMLYHACRTPYAIRYQGKRAAETAREKNSLILAKLMEARGIGVCIDEMAGTIGGYAGIAGANRAAVMPASNGNSDNSRHAMLELLVMKYQRILRDIVELQPDEKTAKQINLALFGR